MQKLVLWLFGASVIVGALMPSQSAKPSEPAPADRHRSRTLQQQQQQQEDAAPQTHVEVGNGAVTLKRASDGHFYAEAQVNGMPIRFLVDTGASSIALSREDAQRAAVPLSGEPDEVIGSGASGEVKGQFVKLDRVSLGQTEVRGVPAAVLSGGSQSLLGQSFLAEFGSVTIQGDTMLLR